MQARQVASELSANGIGKAYGDFNALKDVSLTIGKGEFLTLLGPSGSGKTTFLMILAGFETPSSGSLSKDQINITDLPAEKRAFGMVFQGYALFPHMTVEQNIAFPLQVQKRDSADIKRRVGEMIDRMGLRGHETKRPSGLSGGQQQRVAIGRALVFEPSVLLLDEPFSALDKNLRASMQDEVRRLHKDTGTTFVFVTHDQSEALALSTRVAIFNHGEICQVGSPKEVYERPADRFVAEFLGDVNILAVDQLSENGSGRTGHFEGRSIRFDIAQTVGSSSFAIRPEYMSLSSTAPETLNAVLATVQNITYLGGESRIALVSQQGTPITIRMPTRDRRAEFETGRPVWATWSPDQGFFL